MPAGYIFLGEGDATALRLNLFLLVSQGSRSGNPGLEAAVPLGHSPREMKCNFILMQSRMATLFLPIAYFAIRLHRQLLISSLQPLASNL